MSIEKVTNCYRKPKGSEITANLSEFGKQIKRGLINLGKNQNWLIEEVQKRTGLYFDTSYMHKILTGKNHNPKIVEAIKEILSIKED